MRERAELWLKGLCWLLVAVLLLQTVRALVRNHPFAHVAIPAVPILATDTNSTAGSNILATAKAPVNGPTNLPAGTNQTGTNQVETNLVAKLAATNAPPATNHETNLPPLVALEKPTTNSPGRTNSLAPTNALATTNVLAPTNTLASTNAGPPGTNDLAAGHGKRSHSGRPPMMGGGPFMGGMPGMGGPGKPLPELPAVDRARVDKIVASELLGPVMHPLPMGLLGIAGNVAFLRTASGETGLVKEGDSLGDLKLLRIGFNRVLIEQNGQRQELTIFDGMGGESLLNTSDKNSNETTNH
jgi:hypothetical protein